VKRPCRCGHITGAHGHYGSSGRSYCCACECQHFRPEWPRPLVRLRASVAGNVGLAAAVAAGLALLAWEAAVAAWDWLTCRKRIPGVTPEGMAYLARLEGEFAADRERAREEQQ
jgi:hypothetical protein